jgi:hypothetical protein
VRVRGREAGHRDLPSGREFAFTILDDTDDSRVENARPIYALLHELGMRTTKTLWPVACPEGSRQFFAGSTLADPGYREFCEELRSWGFELSWHCATMESSPRARIERGLTAFEETFGFAPRIHTNHGQNRENIYWGPQRYQTGPLRAVARLRHRHARYDGDTPGSPYFWGDLCRERFPYTRNFTFYDLNTARKDPYFPYRLAETPFVNYWFSTSDAPDAAVFRKVVTRERIDRLRAQGGICILSTHLGKGFATAEGVDPEIEATLRYLAGLPGWFVPVGEILDHLIASRPAPTLRRSQLAALELMHFWDRLRGPH